MGLTLDDLDSMEYGLVVDMMTESGNDSQTYRTLAEQEDFCIAACKEHARACQEKLRTGDDVKAMPVPAFEWWKQTGFYAARRSGFSCGELMYRSVFSNGLVKICFGNRKTFFAPAPDVPEGDVILVTACAFPD